MFSAKRKPAPEPADDLKKWSSQIRKGSLEMCLLAVLAEKPRYGFEIAQHLDDDSGLAVTEGTLYPLLNRLQNEGLIEAYWQESASGPPRKYYTVTAAGREAFLKMRDEWRKYAQAVERILESGDGAQALQPVDTLHVERKPERKGA